jgi:osmoprotectant transport system ATP-binding protein
MSEAELRASNVSKVYPGAVRALTDVDLIVPPGETLAVIGESGCGKSTLLRMFNRLEEPTSGEIHIRGQLATSIDPIRLRRHTGYVQQEGGLLPHWTVGRNVELVPALLDWPRARRRRRAEELLAMVGLDPVTYQPRFPGELSGGQRQRVAFARALAADPDLVLLDEPFGALDALTRLDLHAEFLRLKSRLGKTMVIVTHDLGEAFKLADRVAVMRSGRLLQTGTPEELVRRPATEYVGDLLARGREARP